MSEPRIEHVEATASAEEISTILERDGCVIIDRLLSEAFCDRVLDDLHPWMSKVPEGDGEWLGFKTRRTHGLVAKSPAVRENLCNPLILDILERVIGPWCDSFQLSSSSITSIGPGESNQEVHRDALMFPFTHPTERVAYCTTFLALSAFTQDNGATRVVPGSHRWDDERVAQEHEFTRAVMEKGSVLIFTYAVHHGGGANVTTDEWRHALFASYVVGWLRQEENQYLVSPPDVARHYPEQLQRLIGYQVHRPFLGWYDLQEPLKLLEGYEETTAPNVDLYAEGENHGVLSKNVRRL
jgi:ectoine hydroxylase-related dioxygenase (phytanoyl-CoA dioxygenase family)